MKVLVTGSRGMLGAAIVRELAPRGDVAVLAPTRMDVDLLDFGSARSYFIENRPTHVVHCAARVGGIQANIAKPAPFLWENAQIDINTYRAALAAQCGHFLYFGSSCMYPRDLGRPLEEADILTAPLEPTNEGYALAKIMGAKLAGYFDQAGEMCCRVLIPPNLYGPGDHFEPERSHLIAAVIRKTHEAVLSKSDEVVAWGDGTARREFLFVDDVARFAADSIGELGRLPPLMNVGVGTDHTVAEYYRAIAAVVGFRGRIRYDASKPVGMKRKLMDSRLARSHGWNPRTDLEVGLRLTYEHFEVSHA